MFLLARTRLGAYNLLIVLALATAIAWIGDFDSVVLVSSLGEIPQSLPSLNVPSFSLIPDMLLAGIAVGAVGLLQAAGVAQAYPNRDGSDNDDSRDFAGQGVANIACSFFHGHGRRRLALRAPRSTSAPAPEPAGPRCVQAVVVLVAGPGLRRPAQPDPDGRARGAADLLGGALASSCPRSRRSADVVDVVRGR